jgi:hypothetical protein
VEGGHLAASVQSTALTAKDPDPGQLKCWGGGAYIHISLMQESNCCDARTINTRVTTDMVDVAEHGSITGYQSF